MGILDAVRPLVRAVTRKAGATRRRKGRTSVPGLRSDVEVLFSAGHVPHVYASSADDLFFAQGWVTANERLWQMDVLRRSARGRLSEIFGERQLALREPRGVESGAPAQPKRERTQDGASHADSGSGERGPARPAAAPFHDVDTLLRGRTTVDVDHLMRVVGLADAARASWAVLSATSRRALERYAEGVNARIAEGAPPLECRLLRYTPEPWTPLDALCIQKLLAFELAPTWRAVLAIEALRATPGARAGLHALLPLAPRGEPPLAPGLAQLAAFASAEQQQAALGGVGHAGSNAWVVGPSRSASRAPLLGNDPHLLLTAPGPFFLVHLSAPDEGYDVAGAALPGVPGVLVGHNREIAWGITPALVQDADLYAETLDAEGRYRDGAKWEPLEVRREEIAVRGRSKPAIREIRRTRHGPLLSDVLDPQPEGPLGISLRWTGQAATRELDALLAIDRASGWDEFRAALRHHGAPALHFCYADRAGHIGSQLAGTIPLRHDDAPLVIRDGASDPGWTGAVPWDELPMRFDPPDAVIATADQQVAGAPNLAEPPWRHERVRSLLTGTRRLTPEEMAAIQADQYSGWAARLTETLLVPLATEDAGAALSARAKEALARILAWDHVARPDSDGAALFYLFHDALVRDLLADAVGTEDLHGYLEFLDASLVSLDRLLHDEDEAWRGIGGRRVACARALDRAAERIVARLGADPAGWRWGALHPLQLRHHLHTLRPLGRLLSPGPIETGGDAMTVNGGHFVHAAPYAHRFGAAYRQIFDLADWDRARVITCSGQSGDPLSRHYADQLRLWHDGEYLPLPFGRAAVERAADTAGCLRLAPAAGPTNDVAGGAW